MESPEYVDVYGIPFSVIPFEGRPTHAAAPEDKPKSHVRALPEPAAYEIRFPVVQGYAFALRRNVIRLNDGRTLILEIKGYETAEAKTKHAAAKRWVSAVNHWGQFGNWDFHVCRDPQRLGQELRYLAARQPMIS